MSLSLDDALTLREQLRVEGKPLVFTNGHFDLLHVGHLDYLEKARALGGALIVGLNGDKSSERLKGTGRPIVPDYERARLLSALRCVDGVVLFYDDTAHTLIDALRPDIYVKGGDYHDKPLPERELVESYGGQVVLIDLLPGHSTSELIRRVRALPDPNQPANPPERSGVTRLPLPSMEELWMPPAYPLYPWRSDSGQNIYYAVSHPQGELPGFQWPLKFDVRYVLMTVPAVTYSLMVLMIAIYVLGIFSTVRIGQNLLSAHIIDNGLNATSVLLQGEYQRLFTHTLIHLDAVHLFTNMLGFWLMGRRLEPQFGVFRYGLLLVVSALFTSMLWIILTDSRSITTVGFSGVVYALIGASLVHIQVNQRVLGSEFTKHRNRLAAIVAVLVALDLMGNAVIGSAGPRIDIASHLYGLVSGMFIAWLIAPRMAFQRTKIENRSLMVKVSDTNPLRWRAMGILTVLVVVGLVVFEFLKRSHWPSVFG